ncbi:glycoside hydrolase family 9 protein, partial [Dysgonomonas sp. OttesenSCG-928-D17]|nr:glycoside hydrolase family 9 protein [Dysgonomonas sp. OttesenSCG-928-D17]
VFISLDDKSGLNFDVKDSKTGKIVFSGKGITANAERWGMKQAHRLNFSGLSKEGVYYIECNGVKSPDFRVNSNVYDGTADYVLNYMRQQRCGFNPYLDTVCHQHDGFIVDHPTLEGTKIDVRGGWHDASDYLQYLTTSANTTFQMLFAWQQTPDKSVFKDEYGADGKKGANGIPDILDEVKWGLEWMVRMNPEAELMFNQIADDRDHAGYRLPSRDYVDYGWGAGQGRPVFPVTGKPQGLKKDNMNRSTGVSSSAAKYASAFALGAEIFKDIDPDFCKVMVQKGLEAYDYGKKYPGNNQTACTVSPYFYEEDNWVDDMELAAAVNYNLSQSEDWLKDADYWGQLEEVTPWMELGRARHYQFYPFVNLGHFYLANGKDEAMSKKYQGFMKMGLDCLFNRAKQNDDPFLNGVPFIWCSNNLVTAAATHAQLYYQASGDETYLEMEAALRDWLFGCNPWGTSMISGLPADGDSPMHVHSSYYTLRGENTPGGLVDGPIYKSIFSNLRGVGIGENDPYALFNNGAAVYHDDSGDYSSNEPTMDGTASLTFYLSTMEKLGKLQKKKVDDELDVYGATIRKNKSKKEIRLIFSADKAFEGAPHILQVLDKHKIKGSFFVTGNTLRDERFKKIIGEIIQQGHYLGGHSDNHLQYASWENRMSLVSADSLLVDLRKNLDELNKWGISDDKGIYYLPPYEYYNAENVKNMQRGGVEVINYTPGIRTPADYTTPDMKNYKSSQELIDQLYQFESEKGLNGAIILIHPGTVNERTDKLYNRLDEIIVYLKNKGYKFCSF